jgi:anti-anti-sigma factor
LVRPFLGSAELRVISLRFAIENDVVVEVDGDLDIMNSSLLEQAIAKAEASAAHDARIVVSLAGCDYCDSSSLQVLLEAWRRLGARFFAVVPPYSRCRRLFDVMANVTNSFVVESMCAPMRAPRGAEVGF